MATTAVSPSASPLSPAKINVRLCGSMPRQEMESLSLLKCAQFVLQSESKPFTMAMKPTVHTIEDKDCVASQLCHHLMSMRQQPENQSLSNANVPTFEAPSWAVTAQGESRLEVRTSLLRQHVILSRNDSPLSSAARMRFSGSTNGSGPDRSISVQNRPLPTIGCPVIACYLFPKARDVVPSFEWFLLSCRLWKCPWNLR
jgi:hypothetical protein